jgi:hypothetical protein
VAQVEPDNKVFAVAEGLFWVDCADDIVADQFWYDPADQTIKPFPVEVVPEELLTENMETVVAAEAD